MAGYDDYQTEEEYIAASKRRVTMADTKELVVRLRITSNMVNMGEKISWGQDTALMDEAADALERLERERDEARKECDKLASAWAANLSSKSETVTALRARLAKMEEALRAIDAKVVELGLAAQRKANGHKHEKFAAVRHSMRLIVSAALTEEPQP